MKKTKEIDGSTLFDEILNDTPKEDKLFVTKSLHIASQIIAIIERKNMLQKDFAQKIGKSEAEVSKWLSGFHNFTIKTLTNIEAELGETIITTPKKVIEDFSDAIDKFISNINKNVKINPASSYHNAIMEIKTEIKSDCKILNFIPSHVNKSKTNLEGDLTGTYS